MSPVAEGIIERLESTRQRWWLFTLLSTAVTATGVSFATLLAFMLGDAWLRFPQAVLAALFLIWLALTVILVVLLFRRLLRSQRSLEATARRVECEFPELGSNLINVVQLSAASGGTGCPFSLAAIDQAAARIGRVRFDEAAAKESRWSRLRHSMQTPRDLGESLAALGVLVAVAIVCHLTVPGLGSAAGRLIEPWHFVPAVGSVRILQVTPGDCQVLVGTSLEIVAEIDNPQHKPHRARLFVTHESEEETELPMASDDAQVRYTRMLPSLLKPVRYRLEVGDSQTQVYTVGVREKPTASEVEVTFRYPAYLERPPKTVAYRQADIEAPQFTVAELRIRPATPIASGHVLCEGHQFHGILEQDGQSLVVKLPLLRDAAFTIHLFNDAGHTDAAPRQNRIHVLPDGPPTVELVKPPRESTAKPGALVPVAIRASDDHGLSRVRLEMKVNESETAAVDDPAPVTVEEWTNFAGTVPIFVPTKMELSPLLKPGQTVLLRAVVWDTRNFGDHGLDLKPQQTTGAWHTIRIVGAEVEAAEELAGLDRLWAAIWKILERQVRARVQAAAIVTIEEPGEAVRASGDVRRLQIEIQKSAVAVVNSIGEDQQGKRRTIGQTMYRLALGEMLDAVRLCDELAKITSIDGFAPPVAELKAEQDRIIEVLRGLLDALRTAEAKAMAEIAKRPGGDLPTEVQEKLKAARDKLAEFLAQQKKVIEASENLAKKPVEDFTEEDEALLEKLAATESDWSRFMNELATDLSKLPEQDFSNPSMLEELIGIETELKMAEDALTKKTVDIAVPLEQLGAEMAEEIQTNLEKWLPDEPDRERWSQEESLTDADKEAPMAELPGELEDLVGELMEEEEDLFDEMEDVSSSAADSLDKGAGWDAMDGPISNMSAKGVTGNRLPNTSEIGGRSGEGRSGKSSGEFVADEAVGKGGRKTPSRLTPDPYMAGEVKDSSKDLQGGATGGGKQSGGGEEGLEGPAPLPSAERELQRLAGRQAALRNKAEGIELKNFEVTGFHHTDLEKMIELMAQVEHDLRAGRYQNALRQRKVLAKGLGNVKQFFEGDFEVRDDTTTNLPGDIQKDLLGSMGDPSPPGWEALNRKYFERLTAGGTPGNKDESP